MSIDKPIVFFDGVCGLCDTSVNFLMRNDRRHGLYFATLQGETAQKMLDEKLSQDLQTVILYDKGKIFTKSSAALRALAKTGSFYSVLAIFLIVPKGIRDWIYDWVADNRYKWFGKQDVCRLPTPSEKAFFLD